ncbi:MULTISPECIES: serine/threonine protein kinase [unclassified Coleofasciculus]|uniref:serine/threonine protein kinase n=1 Tax=unclassified Coleofasciculus TaxID=2692782 RepID=UPI00187DF6DA|nr:MULTISPECIES: serine/threonine-protein kinase [unclassified Coleofasciculus]MBE9129055.1 serine/threonine protein kinase [Coleofasciculus sp. LEGE 07081]MBE9151737.1 serine/threonine protein kinase [Coleofasciculus sp. LEGE 07092]
MSQSVTQSVHCINPDCPRPFPQPWGNKFCSGCGAVLQLNNRYVPLQRLGVGGFAAIYTVWDLQEQTEKVLKVLVEMSPKALQLFEQEAAVLVSLKHPGVPKVEPNSYFLVNLGNPPERLLPCLVMEKINGQTLQDVLNDYPEGCPENSVLDWIYQAAEILQELHYLGIIHRDLKPSNLMLREGTGQLVAIDFGGAKQIGSMPVKFQSHSTRLISPGYSPPEQIVGEAVGPAADFYALGRTMIQLLAGQDLADLEDPQTGEFRWRNHVAVSPTLADLLDEMVRLDPQQRPTTAADIQQRLVPYSRARRQFASPAPSFSQALTKATETAKEVSTGAIATCGQGITGLVRFVFRLVTSIVLACLDTTWEMALGGIGAALGAAAGFALINWTVVGDRFAALLSLHWSQILPEIPIVVWRELLLFACAGLGTAWGLTEAGGFGQKKRRLIAGITGILGYSLGWFIWQVSVSSVPAVGLKGLWLVWKASVSYKTADGLLAMVTAVTVAFMVLGLGLPSHYLVHGLVAAAGTSAVFGGLVWLQVLPPDDLVHIFSFSTATVSDFIYSVAFFGLLGVTVGFWLGVSYYLLVPVLRWFGWR